MKRFHEKYTKGPGCWEWQAYLQSDGYGQFRRDGRTQRAHRVAWELANGPIPEGLCVCHKCDNPKCVRPDHLFLGTVVDNVADMTIKGRLACGEANGRAKLTKHQIGEIRNLYSTGQWTHRQLSKQFGVSHQQISNIMKHKNWSKV